MILNCFLINNFNPFDDLHKSPSLRSKWIASAIIWNFSADVIWGGRLISKWWFGQKHKPLFALSEKHPLGIMIFPVFTPFGLSIAISISLQQTAAQIRLVGKQIGRYAKYLNLCLQTSQQANLNEDVFIPSWEV